MLELKELLEVLREENVQELKREHLLKPVKRKRENLILLELDERAKNNPRYVEEYERLLKDKDYSRKYNGLV